MEGRSAILVDEVRICRYGFLFAADPQERWQGNFAMNKLMRPLLQIFHIRVRFQRHPSAGLGQQTREISRRLPLIWPLLTSKPSRVPRHRGLTYGALVGTEPPAPAFFRRDDTALDQTLCSIGEECFVLQDRICVAPIIDLQQRLSINELPSQAGRSY